MKYSQVSTSKKMNGWCTLQISPLRKEKSLNQTSNEDIFSSRLIFQNCTSKKKNSGNARFVGKKSNFQPHQQDHNHNRAGNNAGRV